MKTMNNKLYLIAFIASMLLNACTKSETKSTAKTKTVLLTQAPWKRIKIERAITMNGPFTTDSPGAACKTDNLSIFKTDGTFELNEGATKCNPTDPQIAGAGIWTFENNETVIRVTTSLGALPIANIVSLDENMLVVLVDDSYFNGSPLFKRETYAH